MTRKSSDRPRGASAAPATRRAARGETPTAEQLRVQVEDLISSQAVLAASRDHYVSLFERGPVAEVVLDGHGLILDLNQAASRLMALPWPSDHHYLRSVVLPEDRALLGAHLSLCRADGTAACEVRLQRPGVPEPIWVALRSQLVAEPQVVLTALTDRTDHRRLQIEKERIEEAERRAQAAAKAKDTFIASLSHELRSPLTPILAAVTALETTTHSPEETAKLYELIHRNVLAQAHLVDDLLDVTRIVSGKIQLERQSSNLHLLVGEVLSGAGDELTKRGLTVAVFLEAERCHIDGDPFRLRQVLANVLGNALKFTPAGGTITVRSWNRAELLVIEVADSGVGIPAQALARIFEPFEQGAASVRTGLGLGLAICKGVIGLHGGTIAAQSAGVGKGARFLIELPTKAPTPIAPVEPVPRSSPVRARESRLRLLLIEDEPDIAKAFKIILRSQGHEVHVAANAAEALAEPLEDIDLIVSDIGLPDLDGRELIGRLRARRNVPAIALSGYGTEDAIQASLDAGFSAHVMKPTEMSTLLEAIDAAVGRTERDR